MLGFVWFEGALTFFEVSFLLSSGSVLFDYSYGFDPATLAFEELLELGLLDGTEEFPLSVEGLAGVYLPEGLAGVSLPLEGLDGVSLPVEGLEAFPEGFVAFSAG